MSMENGVIMQFFEWFYSADGSLWNHLASSAPHLRSQGITAIWIPPCHKGKGGGVDVGYGVYDLFDLGEFDQMNSIRTKYGTKDELLNAINAIHDSGMQCYCDVVFNHKDGGDDTEEVWVQEVNWKDRNEVRSDWYPISAYTKFTFPGRGNHYSAMKWYWWCFDALSYNAVTKRADILYRLKDKTFETEVSHEHGNYDYLMANDLDTDNEFVRGELMYWGRWILDTLNVDGFRIDAVKHIRASFFPGWLGHVRNHSGNKELFSVGEYWDGDLSLLLKYIERTGGAMSLFDVPLHFNFHNASRAGSSYDMRSILEGTLIAEQPSKAVTFVENHDSQPCCSLESPVEPWFKPLAYALILLRREGYPCVFYGDYYGTEYPNCRGGYPVLLYSQRWMIDKLLWARKTYGYGDQHDYFDHPNTIGWVRTGNESHPGAMAVVMSNGGDGYKWMNVFHPNTKFYDQTEHFSEKVRTNADGWGQFLCKGGKVSVWLQE